MELALDQLADQLQLARDRGEVTGIISHYDRVECSPGVQLYEMLTSEELDRDCRLRIYGLLDKCIRLDSDPEFYIDPEVSIEGRAVESYALAYALLEYQQAAPVGTLAIETPNYGPGIIILSGSVGTGEAVMVTDDPSRQTFYRWSYRIGDVQEEDFFALSSYAFPNLRFADGVSFKRFEGAYRDLREPVVDHLAKINDHFPTAYARGNGRADLVTAAVGIDITMESPNTRRSETLMRHRDAVLDNRIYRCEWHSKIEAHRNRVHIHPGDDDSEGCVVIGIFVAHLPT